MKSWRAVLAFLFLSLSTCIASVARADDDFKITPDVVYGHKAGMALTFDVVQPTSRNALCQGRTFVKEKVRALAETRAMVHRQLRILAKGRVLTDVGPLCVRCSVLHPTPAVATETAGVCDASNPRTWSGGYPRRRFWALREGCHLRVAYGALQRPRLWRASAFGRRRASTAGLSLFISRYT